MRINPLIANILDFEPRRLPVIGDQMELVKELHLQAQIYGPGFDRRSVEWRAADAALGEKSAYPQRPIEF
mgnify:CR=1 FL=1